MGLVTDYAGACEALDSEDLWESDYHIIAADRTVEDIPEITITDLADQLRFESKTGADRLTLVDGRVNPQQLQSMRILTPESAKMLRETLDRSTTTEESPMVLPEEIGDTAP